MANIQAIQESYSDYIVAPIARFGLGGFRFDIEGDTDVDLSADITDHYVEDNSALQDHIAIRPRRLTLNSRVGELVFLDENETVQAVQEVLRKLVVLVEYLPELSAGAEQARQLAATDFVDLSEDSLDTIENLWAITKNLNPAATRQQQAYLYFRALLEKRIPVSVQTPFGYMQDMAIEGVSVTQFGESSFVSSFSLSLKEIRTASLQLVDFDPDKYQSRGAEQIAGEVDNGSTNGEQRDSSVLFDIFSNVGGGS